MNTHDDGGLVFPVPFTTDSNGYIWYHVKDGMSLRDWFAGMALQGIIAGSGHPIFDDHGENKGQAQDSIQEALTDGPGPPHQESNSTCSNWAWIAYCTADAMLAARKEAK
jgi:hypothetical protein